MSQGQGASFRAFLRQLPDDFARLPPAARRVRFSRRLRPNELALVLTIGAVPLLPDGREMVPHDATSLEALAWLEDRAVPGDPAWERVRHALERYI